MSRLNTKRWRLSLLAGLLLCGCELSLPEENVPLERYLRPDFAKIDVDQVDLHLVDDLQVSAAEVAQLRAERSAIPIEERRQFPTGDAVRVGRDEHESYHALHLQTVDFYREHTNDSPEARGPAEKFLSACADFVTGHETALPADEIVELGEAAIEAGSADPNVALSLALRYVDIGESETAYWRILESLQGLQVESVSPIVRCFATIWRFRLAVQINPHAYRIHDKGRYEATSALVDLWSSMNDYDRLRQLRFQIDTLFLDRLNHRSLEDLLVACLVEGDVPMWQLHMVAGQYYWALAWNSRGGGPDSVVSDSRWRRFYRSLARSYCHYLRAWQLDPEVPEASAALVRVASTGIEFLVSDEGGSSDFDFSRLDDVSGNSHTFLSTVISAGVEPWTTKDWFFESVHAEFDYEPAYESYLWSMMQQQSGRYEDLIEFAQSCLATQRWDTLIPSRSLSILERIYHQVRSAEHFARIPGVLDVAHRFVDGVKLAKQEGLEPQGETASNYAFAANIFVHGGWNDEARNLFEELGDRLSQWDFDQLREKKSYLQGRTAAMLGPAGAEVQELNSQITRWESDASVERVQQLQERLADVRQIDSSPESQPYYDDLAEWLRQTEAYEAGEWVEIEFDQNLSGLRLLSGDVEIIDKQTAHIKGKEGHTGPVLTLMKSFALPYVVEATMTYLPDESTKSRDALIGIVLGHAVTYGNPTDAYFHFGAAFNDGTNNYNGTTAIRRLAGGRTRRDQFVKFAQGPTNRLRIKAWTDQQMFFVDNYPAGDNPRFPTNGHMISFGSPNRPMNSSGHQSFLISRVRIRKLTDEAPPSSDDIGSYLAYYERALEHNPEDAFAKYQIANACLSLGDSARALALLQEVEPELGGMSPFHYLMGLALWNADQHAQARDVLSKAVNRDEGSALVQFHFAELLSTSNVESVRDGKWAYELAYSAYRGYHQEENPAVFTILAAACAANGDFESAVDYQTQALEFAPEPSHAQLERYIELYRRGEARRESTSDRYRVRPLQVTPFVGDVWARNAFPVNP